MNLLFRTFLVLLLFINTNNFELTPNSQIDTDSKLLQKLKEDPKLKTASFQDSEELTFNNASWVDYPIDDDNNGLYDNLVISNISLTNLDQIYYLLGVLKSTNGTCLGRYKETITPYDVNISLSFDGPPINASGINGHYEVWMSVSTNPDHPSPDFALMYTTSKSYDANEFEKTSALIIGFSDEGYDSDGDSLFDGIEIQVEIKVLKTSFYVLSLILDSANPYSLETAKLRGEWNGELNASIIATVTVNISVNSFYSTKLNGSLSVDMAYIAESWWPGLYLYHHFFVNAYNTSFYHFSQFKPPDIYLTGNYNDLGLDTDADGRFNELVIDLEINVTLNGTYYIRLWLSTLIGDNSFAKTVEKNLEVGIHIVSISFDVITHFSLYSQQLNTSYWVETIRIQNWDHESLIMVYSPYISRKYNYTEFNPPKIFLTGNYNDWGHDNDVDLRYNLLVIGVEINVNRIETYYLRFYLRLWLNTIKGDVPFYREREVFQTEGIQIHEIDFDVSGLYSQQLNTSYVVSKIRIESREHQNLGEARFSHITRTYNYTEFDPPEAFLTGNYNDRGIDTDANGLINQLIIEVEVNVSEPDIYFVDITLKSTEENRNFYSSAEAHLEVGTYNFSFSFEGSKFYSLRANTSYRISYIVFGKFGFAPTINNPYITRVYNYTEFEPPAAYIKGILNDWGQDTDGDGLFNQLILDVEINVTVTGSYIIWIYLESTVEYELYSGEVEDYLTIGIHKLAIPIDISSYIFQLNTSYKLADRNTNTWIADQTSNVIDEAYVPYITRVYNYTEFDGPGAILTGNYYDRGLDTNGDGRFDKFVIDVEVNFTTPGDYQINLEVISYGRNDVNADSSISGYWEMGVRNISMPIPTYSFYATMINSVYIIENVAIYDSKTFCLEWVDRPYTSRVYNFTEFDIGLIYIDGNSEFSKLIQAENWKGDGSRSNPYIIEDLSLKSLSSTGQEGTQIQILNTNNYFTITNCSLTGGEVGIYLSNVMNGNISYNIIQDNKVGITLQFTDNNTIAYNTINGNSMGVIVGTQSPVEPLKAECNNNLIINNAIFDNDLFGLSIGVESKNNVVKWNDFRSNAVYDNNGENSFIENYWFEWAENESTSIPLVGNQDINPYTSPNHLSKPVVLFPNYRETLISKVLIDWVPAKDILGHDVTYTVYYSSDNGNTWNLLASDLTITNYQWEFQNISFGSFYLIKVVGFDSFGFYSMDRSDHPFTIRSPPQPPSTLPFRIVVLLVLFSFLFILIRRKT
ncbi:MAG: NosD domain-containing protein [Candidatus Hodarchaeota archaeon]